eukprot:g18984.t1
MASSFSGPTAWAYVSLDAHLDGVAQILKSLDLPFSLLQQIRQRRAVDPPEADDLFRCPDHILNPSTRADAGGEREDGSLELRSDLLRQYLLGETSTAHDESSGPISRPEDGFRIVLAERVVHSEDVADSAAEDDTGGDHGGKAEGRESLLGLRSLFKKTRGAIATPVRTTPKGGPKVGTERLASSSCRGCFPDRSRGAARPAARGNTAVGEGKTDDGSRLREGSHACSSRDSRLLLAGLQEEVESLTLKCRRYLRDADLVEIWCAKRGDRLLWLATLRFLLEHALTTVRDAVSSLGSRASRG